MKTSIPTLLAVSLWCATASIPARAQTAIPAPAGWTTQTRAAGARVFTPPGLQNGEKYSVTLYDSQSLDGKTLDEWLRGFAGPVGTKPGQLAKVLQIKARGGSVAGATGFYIGPNGTSLGVTFIAVAVDGANIHVARTLFSHEESLARYRTANQALMDAMRERAEAEAGRNIVRVPARVSQKLRPGGDVVAGVYVGNQYQDAELKYRLRVHLYASGEYTITKSINEPVNEKAEESAALLAGGEWKYNRNTGQLEVSGVYELANDEDYPDTSFCYYGRNQSGKPTIYAEEGNALFTTRTSLLYIGPSKRPSESAQAARKAAIEAEKQRYKWVTAPGKGLKSAQIAALLHHQRYADDQMSSSAEAYLLLRDGTIRAGLPVPIDQMDVVRSRQREPEKWGKWRQRAGKYQVSWQGGPYGALVADKAVVGAAGTRLNGYYGSASSSSLGAMGGSFAYWGVTFKGDGRFEKTSRGGGNFNGGESGVSVISGYDDNGSGVVGSGGGSGVSVLTKKNPNGDRQGTYTVNGYTLTLRYDNGQVVRMPFFFSDAARKQVWFEGDLLSLDFAQ